MPRLDLFNSNLMYFGPTLWNSLPVALTESRLMYSGPTLWNSLPVALTESSTMSVFKHRLSTHMLSSLGITQDKIRRKYHSDAPFFLKVHACLSIVIKVLIDACMSYS